MKKLKALTFTLLLSFSLTACGSENNASTGAGANVNDSPTMTDETISNNEGQETTNSDDGVKPEDDQEENSKDSDYIKEKGTLVVGVTDFEPMDYTDDNGEWIGFDADIAKAFAKSLGVTAEFIEIDWDNKIMELDGKTIDCVWNGMTLTDEVTSSMECSNAYCNNAQVVVLPSNIADKYQDADSLSDLSFAVETGSAGEKEAEAHNLNYTSVKDQASALMEVASGTSDAAIIDSLMADAMVGEGTGYADLTHTVALNSEEYGVGFRKGSDLAAELNTFFDNSYADGSMLETAEKYSVQAALIKKEGQN